VAAATAEKAVVETVEADSAVAVREAADSVEVASTFPIGYRSAAVPVVDWADWAAAGWAASDWAAVDWAAADWVVVGSVVMDWAVVESEVMDLAAVE
jgi:hypothetical protein